MAITHERMRYNVGQLDSFGQPDNQKTLVLSPTLDAVTVYKTYTGGETTSTFSHTIDGNGNRALIVATCYRFAGYATGVTYSGTSMNAYITYNTADISIQLWYLLEANLPAAGAHNVVVTTAAAEDMEHVSTSWDNVGGLGDWCVDTSIANIPTVVFNTVPGDTCISFCTTLGKVTPLQCTPPATLVTDTDGVTGNLTVGVSSLVAGDITCGLSWATTTSAAHCGLVLKQYQNPGPLICLDSISYGTTSGSNSISWTHTVGTLLSNRALFLFAAFGDGSVDTVNATYNAAAMTGIGFTRSGNNYTGIWYKANPTTGANTLNFHTVGASNMYAEYWGVSMYGVNQTTAADGSGGSMSTDPVTFTAVTLNANELLAGTTCYWNNTGSYLYPDSGQRLFTPFSTSWFGKLSSDGSWQGNAGWRRGGFDKYGWGVTGNYSLSWANAGLLTACWSYAHIYPA